MEKCVLAYLWRRRWVPKRGTVGAPSRRKWKSAFWRTSGGDAGFRSGAPLAPLLEENGKVRFGVPRAATLGSAARHPLRAVYKKTCRSRMVSSKKKSEAGAEKEGGTQAGTQVGPRAETQKRKRRSEGEEPKAKERNPRRNPSIYE